MPRRRTAKFKGSVAGGGEPPACFCGGGVYDYTFTRFPMTHIARCKACGLEHRCELKVSPAKPRPQPPQQTFDGWPPFFYP